MNTSHSDHNLSNGRSNQDIDWARFGLGNRESNYQHQKSNSKSDRVPGETDFGSEYHYGPAGHHAPEVNELYAEEQVIYIILVLYVLM
jgi:hypothetical protein